MCEACENNGHFVKKEINGWPIMIAYNGDGKIQIWGPWGCVTDDAVCCHKCGKTFVSLTESEERNSDLKMLDKVIEEMDAE